MRLRRVNTGSPFENQIETTGIVPGPLKPCHQSRYGLPCGGVVAQRRLDMPLNTSISIADHDHSTPGKGHFQGLLHRY